ncbi:unnamed protein product, partial [Lymnaea stagnalis]
MLNVLGVLGIVGNSINIAVLSQHRFRESTNIILISLSTSDLLFSMFLPVTRLKCLVSYIDPALAVTVDTYVTVYFFMPKFVCLGTSFWYVGLIGIERFFAVIFPFHVAKIFTRRRVTCLTVSIFCFSFAIISPTFFTLRCVWVFDSAFNRTVAIVDYTEFYLANQEFLDFYMWVGLNNLFCTLSFIVVCTCCFAIIVKLMRAAVKRELMTSRSGGYDVKVVKMLVTVCGIFVIVGIPTITMYSYFKPNFIFVSPVHKLMSDIGDILFLANASSNFLVYVTMSSKFAKTYKTLFGCGQ